MSGLNRIFQATPVASQAWVIDSTAALSSFAEERLDWDGADEGCDALARSSFLSVQGGGRSLKIPDEDRRWA